jgi:anaerobic magnesium-protoporphyrin IX monomethyl ester cyclase
MNLYQIPPLDYSSIDSPEGLEKFNQTAMFIRGCKGNCAFCTSPNYWSRELSENSINNFEQELEFLAKNGVEIIGILDDDILASEQGFESIIKSLEKIKTKYPTTRFIAQTRVTHFRNPEQNQEKLTKMKQAGVDRLYVGIESGSQQILNQMAKGYKVEWVKPALENIKDAGIETGGFWLFGHPGATKEEENRSLAFMEELLEKRLLDDVEAHCVVPFPGTRIAKDLRVQVFDHNKKHYGFLNNYPVYNLVNPETGKIEMSASEIFGFLQQALEIRKKYLGIEANLANRPLEKN